MKTIIICALLPSAGLITITTTGMNKPPGILFLMGAASMLPPILILGVKHRILIQRMKKHLDRIEKLLEKNPGGTDPANEKKP